MRVNPKKNILRMMMRKRKKRKMLTKKPNVRLQSVSYSAVVSDTEFIISSNA
jgi:hypothetical protein